MEEKIANHACMNEQFFLEFHMATSHIEMQRKRNRDGALNNTLFLSPHTYAPGRSSGCMPLPRNNTPATSWKNA